MLNPRICIGYVSSIDPTGGSSPRDIMVKLENMTALAAHETPSAPDHLVYRRIQSALLALLAQTHALRLIISWLTRAHVLAVSSAVI